jgi:predicted RNA-binding Zn-ribbon protein involved in translation (DUF1610 family)
MRFAPFALALTILFGLALAGSQLACTQGQMMKCCGRPMNESKTGATIVCLCPTCGKAVNAIACSTCGVLIEKPSVGEKVQGTCPSCGKMMVEQKHCCRTVLQCTGCGKALEIRRVGDKTMLQCPACGKMMELPKQAPAAEATK